jgi:hypothetical protein
MGILHTTDASGIVSFTAPLVSRSENYPLSSFSPGYQVNNETIIVTPTGSEEGFGWIYGSVQDSSGTSLRDVQLSAVASGGGMSRCVFSGDSGQYTLAVPPGAYTVVARKAGFQTVGESSVMVRAGEAVGLSFNLSSIGAGGNLSGDQDVMEALIDAGVVAQRIVGRLDVDGGGQYSFLSYDESLSGSMLYRAQGTVVFSVSHRNASGAVVAVRLADLGGGGDVGVLVDGQAVSRVGVGEVMSAGGGSALFARVVDVVGGRSVVYCLVYLPHFSSYTVEVRSVLQATVTGGIVLVFLGVAGVVAVVVLVPILFVERRRR